MAFKITAGDLMLLDGDSGKVQTEQDILKAQILDGLRRLGGLTVQDDAIQFEGTKIILPEQYSGRVEDAVDFLKGYIKDQSETYNFSRTYNYRPWDGASAFQRAMKRTFGTAGIGKKIETFFGDYPPEYVTIAVGPNQTESIPWGQVGLNLLEAVFTIGGVRNKEYGNLFRLAVTAPKKYRREINAFFEIVGDELKTDSIYRGKAINGAAEPAFIDTSRVDPNKIVYSKKVLRELGANVWSLLDHSDTMREEKLPLKRQVLLEGKYGTGKSLAGALTAQRAVRNGWTYILVRPGQDDLYEALQTAQIYAPAVVLFEDIDVLSVGASAVDMSKLLDMLDSVNNKGVEVIALFTTNHVERLPKGVLRPGRIDAIINIGGLDKSGYEKLVKSLIRADLLGNIDFDAVAKAFGYVSVPKGKVIQNDAGLTVVDKDGALHREHEGYVLDVSGDVYAEGMLPAFAREAIEGTQRYVIDRDGKPGVIETEDIVAAALGLRRQLQLMEEADEGVSHITLDTEFRKLVDEQVRDTLVGNVRIDQNADLLLVEADRDS